MMYIITFIFLHILYAQFPINLIPNQTSEPFIYYAEQDNEFLLTLTASTNTNWSIQDSESATLVIAINGDWENYNQDIVLYAGNINHEYHVSLGFLPEGEHLIEFKFDYSKSSLGSTNVQIVSADIIDIITFSEIDLDDEWDIDYDVFLHSPILYGRDLLSWNESTHTDIPLLMWHEIFYFDDYKTIKYSIIFSNEDSRVGIGLADLMFNYGRTTDIEWVYEVMLDNNGEIISETFQGPSHITTNFNGQKIDKHPILKNATLNCNFTDLGSSEYKFFLSPAETFNGYIVDSNNEIIDTWQTRETLMEDQPWTYRIMAEELINEGRYEQIADPETVEISDVRNYIYIEYYGSGSGDLDLIIKFHDNCEQYYHNHNFDEFSSFYNGGPVRTSIEIPENFNPTNIASVGFLLDEGYDYEINISSVKLFYLDSDYIPTYLPGGSFSGPIDFTLNDNNSGYWLNIYENEMNLDCFGNTNGSAECDECGVCNGANLDIDDCGICFGNNLDMDCDGVCFGVSMIDDCGVCDTNSTNDNSTCSGCIDVNALNYDENAVFYDGSCIYSDNLFLVPSEYHSIQNAIFFASDGDTIEVGEGVYQENINFLTKSIVLRSEPGLDVQPTISGIDSLSTITIENSIEASIIGFQITNGYGQGVSFDDFLSLAADPIAFDSLITKVLKGGGLSIINSSPYIKDLYITNNTARNVGAGIGLINSSAIIESTIIDNNNIADGDALGGGGIAINGGSPTLIDVKIRNNFVGTNMYSLNGGGGILCGFSFGDIPLSLNMYNTTISNNFANIGAGIGVLSGEIFIDRVLIKDNEGDFGSAISMGEPLGLVVGDINMNLINSTIVNNSGMITVGLINSAYLNILNSIFWDNNGEFSPMPNNSELNINSAYSLFETPLNGQGNINLDPLFINSDYILSDISPCIDTGTDYFIFDNTIINIDSYYGEAPDMGFKEFECISSIGDVNLDQSIDILDILEIINIIMDFSIPTNYELCRSDINQDNIVDIFDIITIINIILS